MKQWGPTHMVTSVDSLAKTSTFLLQNMYSVSALFHLLFGILYFYWYTAVSIYPGIK